MKMKRTYNGIEIYSSEMKEVRTGAGVGIEMYPVWYYCIPIFKKK